MKKSILKSSNWLYGFIMGLLGFTQGCQDGAVMYGPPPPNEYDTPTATYMISGRVTDANNNPIKDIRVGFALNDYYSIQIFTGNDGSYSFQKNNPSTDLSYTITYKDDDGEKNGGNFADQIKKASFKSEDFTGGNDNFYQGMATKVVDVVLEEKVK